MIEVFGTQLDGFVLMFGALAIAVIVTLYYFLIRGRSEGATSQAGSGAQPHA